MRFCIPYIFLIFCISANSQNYINVTADYITNPSFEDHTSCPLGLTSVTDHWIDSCIGWTTPTYATSDYFNSCNTNGSVGVPNNYPATYQPSFHGKGYCGFLAYSSWSNSTWSEYIQTKLKKKLVTNEIYSFSMRINRANNFNISVQNIGANFSKDSLRNYNYFHPFNFTPTILNKTGFLNDTLNWTIVSGSFKATGDEEYLTIGWFGDTIQKGQFGNTLTTDCYFLIPPDTDIVTGELLFVPEIYYLVDSLTLSAPTKKNISNFSVNIFTPNNDGVNDVIDFSIYNLSTLNFDVYNRWGNLVFTSNDINLKWSGLNFNNNKLNDGVYFYILSAEIPDVKDKIQKQGYISIIN